MKKFIKQNYIDLLLSLYSFLNAMMFLAMRINYAGISKALGADKVASTPNTIKYFFVMYLPIIVCALFFLVFIFTLVNLFYLKKKEIKWVKWAILGTEVVFSGLIIGVIIGGSKDYLDFILPHYFKSLVISLIIILFAFILFFPIENDKKGLITKVAIMVLVIGLSIFIGYDIKGNYFTYDSVVYAVEDDYQIVFSTNDESNVWVEVGGESFYDLYAGSQKSKDNVHKVIVPQEKLDQAKSYTIYARHILYRGPFGGYTGRTISKTHDFKPVEDSKNFNYYVLTDVHESINGAVKAANKAKETYGFDFLVMLGDMSSMVETEYYANFNNKIASKVTNGEMPVLYTRGNHEIKGLYAEELYKYVGSKDEKFYYEFSLCNGKIKGISLDLGEDHDDGWWEYFDTDRFDLYRDEQTEFLKGLNKDAYKNADYSMVICHIPIVFVNTRKNHNEYKSLWTEELNTLGIDAGLFGHQHELNFYDPTFTEIKTLVKEPEGTNEEHTVLYNNDNWYEEPGERYAKKAYLTNYNFNGYMCGRCSLKQGGETSPHGTSNYTGLLIKVNNASTQTSIYTNSKGEKVPVMSIFKNDHDQEAHEERTVSINNN